MKLTDLDLLVTRDSLALHGSTTAVGDLEFVTIETQWSYAVSLPIVIAEIADPDLLPLVVVELQVLDGSVGVGVLDNTKQRYLTTEVDVVAAGRPARIELRLEVSGLRGHVMVRNTAAGRPSRFKLLGLRLQFAPAARALLRPVTPPDVAARIHGAPAVTGVFDILISHSSRRWFAEQCERSLLRERYARPDRLQDLPPFEALPQIAAPYHGLLSVFRLELSPAGVTGRVLRHYLSAEKVVHAAVVGHQVVVCLDAGIATFPQRREADWEMDTASAERIVDPWFGGLHTVVPVDERTCVVSSSGADAVLWVDVERKEVTRRWRLPSARYGVNYALDLDTWLAEHYISNDLQLGHLNCAVPDGRGGVYISVLGQGDIGHVDSSGHFELLVTGFIGCHGVRYDLDRDLLYFCDSCGGTLVRVDGKGRTTTLFDAGSRWLHDAVHLSGGLFLLTVADRNQLVLADTDSGRALAEWDFSSVDGTVQFLSDVSP